MKTCADCHTLPGCGWCDDGSGTGLGQCMDGGDDGPFTKPTNSSMNQCLADRWYFMKCPGRFNLDIRMHILYTVPYTFPKVLLRRICLIIKNLLTELVIISFILVTIMCDSGVLL